MDTMDAEDALRYIASRDVLVLVGVALLGGVLTVFGSGWMMPWHGRGTGPFLVSAISLGVFITGAALEIGAILALFYKIIADATA